MVKAKLGSSQEMTSVSNPCVGISMTKSTVVIYSCVGLLAGMWPCGVITILDELFKSESKSQVYGCLHGFFHNNPSTANIGEYRN